MTRRKDYSPRRCDVCKAMFTPANRKPWQSTCSNRYCQQERRRAQARAYALTYRQRRREKRQQAQESPEWAEQRERRDLERMIGWA